MQLLTVVIFRKSEKFGRIYSFGLLKYKSGFFMPDRFTTNQAYSSCQKNVSVTDFKYVISRFKVRYTAIHFSFLKSRTKILLPLYLDRTFAYFLRTFTKLLPFWLGKYFANSPADSCFQYSAFLSFVIIPRYLLAGFHSSEFVPFIVVPHFSRLHFLQCSCLCYSHSYKVWGKYACPFISKTVKIQLQHGKSTVKVWLQVGWKYDLVF